MAAGNGEEVPASGTTLKCYLNWEMSPRRCLDLEVALLSAVQQTPGRRVARSAPRPGFYIGRVRRAVESPPPSAATPEW
ncbi:hypothetical protein PG999_014122 [Apiospora kogelbergensis]|uniref:Uncharacterized protein n=1 Tax=Apiospora kogelbergensis TaxID=1337665 RepID=A0AAW0QHC9_9PEZI